MKDNRKLFVEILTEKDKSRKDMLYGIYKPKLSKEKIKFLDTKLNRHPYHWENE